MEIFYMPLDFTCRRQLVGDYNFKRYNTFIK